MSQVNISEKGQINEGFNLETLNKNFPLDNLKKFTEKVKLHADGQDKSRYLEISHSYTPLYQILLNEYKEGVFLSDDPFESLLVYYSSQSNGKKVTAYNYKFNYQRLTGLKWSEQFDLVVSYFGLSFKNLTGLLPQLINLIKVNGLLAVAIPAYWYLRENLTENEKTVLKYSKENDKDWIFTEPIEPLITKNNSKILEISELPFTVKFNRYQLAYLSSLSKLLDAEVNHNIAHLEITGIPEESIDLRAGYIIIQKTSKTYNKDTLFNL